MEKKINIVILDDHQMVLEGISKMLDSITAFDLSASFSEGCALLQYLESNSPDVILLDINLKVMNGLDVCKTIGKEYPEIKIIGLTNYNDSGIIKSMMRNGASGYLLKNLNKQVLEEAINKVYNGEVFISSELEKQLLNESIGGKAASHFIPKLTRREKEVLHCISNEMTNTEMAEELFISVKTVESHRNNLLQKFGVRNTAGLIKIAFQRGLLK